MEIISGDSPSGSNICGATASPVCNRKSKRPSGGNKPIQEEGIHEVSIQDYRKATRMKYLH